MLFCPVPSWPCSPVVFSRMDAPSSEMSHTQNVNGLCKSNFRKHLTLNTPKIKFPICPLKPVPCSAFFKKNFFLTTFIVVQRSSQPNFISFPSQTPSPCLPPPNLSPLETVIFSKSVSHYLFCKQVHCIFFLDSTYK